MSYADCFQANAVARHDNLEFLTDVVPRTMTYKAYKEKRAKEVETAEPARNGINIMPPPPVPTNGHGPQAPSQTPDVDSMDIDSVPPAPGHRVSASAMQNGATVEPVLPGAEQIRP